MGKGKLGRKGSKTIQFNPTKSKGKFNFKLCKNVFDNVADKLKNVTKHIADGAVNKGREWLKNKFGNDCDTISKNIKKSKRSQQNNDNISLNEDKSPSPVLIGKNTLSDDNIKPTNNKIIPPIRVRTNRPITNTDDNTRPPIRLRTNKPITNTDDNTRPPRHIRTNKPITNTDDNTRLPRHARRPIPNVTKTPILITFRPSKQPTIQPSVNPTKIPSAKPTIIPSVTPTIPPTPWPTYQQLSWAMFSVAPTIYTNIPPTLVPTKSMFTMLTNPPTNIKTNRPSFRVTSSPSSIHPTIIITRTPTQQPTQQPSQQPTQQPSQQPTQSPTPIVTQNPTNFMRDIYTSPPTTDTLSSLSKDVGSNNQQSGLNTTIAIIVVIIVVFFIVTFSYFIIKNNGCEKPSAYRKWVNHYDNNKINNSQSTENQDIHHFYSKSAPPFKPHISIDNRKRYSAQPQRLSLSPSRRSSMIDRNTML